MWRKYFKVIKIVPGPVIIQGFGTIDFSSDKVPVEICKQLFEADCRYLEITAAGMEELYGIHPVETKQKVTESKAHIEEVALLDETIPEAELQEADKPKEKKPRTRKSSTLRLRSGGQFKV